MQSKENLSNYVKQKTQPLVVFFVYFQLRILQILILDDFCSIIVSYIQEIQTAAQIF